MADIKSIAEKLTRVSTLLGLSPVEIFAIAQMLAEDYGIKPVEDIHLKKEILRGIEKVFTMKDVTTRLEIEKEYKPKQRML